MNKLQQRKERVHVTVCIAAICRGFNPGGDGYMIIGAADRMLTAGNIEFEPQTPKIYPLSTSIYAMTSGDSSLQSDIMATVVKVIRERIVVDPKKWWSVRDVAEVYVTRYQELRLSGAKNLFLAPLSLTLETFIKQTRTMSAELVDKISNGLLNFELTEDISTIFCGVDMTGPHIYVVRGSQIECRDAVGFAAIGVGGPHADSQFMFARHSFQKTFAETLLLTYVAKRRAEVAPGVGQATDMFLVGPGLGVCTYPVFPHVIEKIGEIYKEAVESSAILARSANQKIQDFVDIQIKKHPQAQASPDPLAETNAPMPESSKRDTETITEKNETKP